MQYRLVSEVKYKQTEDRFFYLSKIYLILESIGIKNTCYNYENILNMKTKKVQIHAIKATSFCMNQTTTTTTTTKGIIKNFKPFQDGKKQIEVAKWMFEGGITTLTRQYIYS